VTLIIGMRCSDGVVVCADAQETVGHYRVSVKKIEPVRMGNYVVIVAGSGIGDLVDGFAECLRETVSDLKDRTLAAFKRAFETELKRYCKEEVPLYSAGKEEDKKLEFVVAAYVNGICELWSTKGMKLKTVPDYCPIGWVEPLYKRILESFFKPGMTVAQGVLTCVYTLGIAEATSNYVRGPMQVGGVNNWGAWLDGSGYVTAMHDRLLEFEQRAHAVLLASADIGMNLAQYRQMLDAFTKEATKLHKESLVAALRRFLSESADTWQSVNVAYDRIPPALSLAIQTGDLDDVLGPGVKADLLQKMIDAAKAAHRVEGDLE
jgi:20S proteasome alpha/beta subunit